MPTSPLHRCDLPLMLGSLSALALALASISCVPDSNITTGGDQAYADAGPDSGRHDDDLLRPDAANCGDQQEEIPLIEIEEPPDLLIVLDRSSSMSYPVDIFGAGDPRWDIMTEALTNVTAAKENDVRFGLAVFPSGGGDCDVSSNAKVPVEIGNAGAIADWMASHGPTGKTPAAKALRRAREIYESMPVNPTGRYVLFATDGIPNCDGDPSPEAETVRRIEELAAAGIPTYVLGFGDAAGFDTDLLNDAALAGGVPRADGPPHYYPASSAEELEAVLETISGGVILPSCEYALASPPPDPDQVTVLADGEPVPRSPSHTDGWDYHPDASTISFFGSYCADIQAGAIANVQFIFGCLGPSVD